MKDKTREELLAELDELKLRLMESEETLDAIRSGEVDALVVSSPDGDQIYSLEGTDQAYRTLIEEMNEGAAILMKDTTIFYCNSRLAGMVKVPLEEMMGNSIDSFISPMDRGMYEALLKKGLERNSSSGEISLRASDGTYLPVFISIKKLKLKDIDGFSLNVTDLSEQKRNEEILESERLSRCIFEQAGESIIVCDENGIITRASSISHDLCDCNPILEYFNNVLRLHDENMSIFSVYSVLKGKSIQHMEVFSEQDDGSRVYLLLSARAIYNREKEIIGCVIILTDITERKKAEEEKHKLLEDTQRVAEELEVSNEELQSTTEELQLSNEELQKQGKELLRTKEQTELDRKRLETILETTPSAVVIVEASTGKISYINRRAKQLYGIDITDFDLDNAITKVKSKRIDGSDYPPGEGPSGRALKGQEVYDEEMIMEQPDGTVIPILVSAAPIFNSEGEVIAAVAIFEDITDRKKNEDALKEARDNLEEKVEERTVELKEAIKELERSNKELESFAYITSHDLQEPLRSIASYSQLIKRRYEGQLDSDADEFIEFMVNGAKRMKQMIQGLLEYSRINRGETEFVKTDMNANVEKAVSNLQYAIGESNAEITQDNLPTVIADPDQMVMIFQNLIGNAIKFKKPQLPPRIHISSNTDKEKNESVFSVTDNGIGIEKQYNDHIFEVFKRLHPMDEYEGAGIGLAIFKRIVDSHGGRVWVESSLGEGSTFYFTIPVKV